MVRRRTRNKKASKKAKIEWDVPKSERSAGRGAARAKPRVVYTGTAGREDFKPDRGSAPVWNSAKDKLTGGVKQLPPYETVVGMSEQLAAALVPGRMLVLTEHVQLFDPVWSESKAWPVPKLECHFPREYDETYDPKKEIHMPKGGMIVYAGHEVIDAKSGGSTLHSVRMDIHKFLVRDGIYVIMNMRLVDLPS